MRGPLAIGALAALPGVVAAQEIACSFTLVCAPQIDCVPHEGVPFSLTPEADGRIGFTRDGEAYSTTPEPRGANDGPLTLLFNDPQGSLLFTLSDTGSAVLTEHRVTGAGRVEHSSFSGTCEVM